MKKTMKYLITSVVILSLSLVSGAVYAQTLEEQIAALEERIAEAEKQAGDALGIAKGFEFHGYARSGFGMTSEGGSVTNEGDFQPFRLNGAGAKYRLGNEGDTYVETRFIKNWYNDDGSHFKVEFQPTYKEGNDRDWVEYGGNEAKLTLRQAYAEANNVFGGLSVWAGERFYRRSDIHIMDFYYNHPVGLGAGVQNIQLGEFGNLAIAWLNTSRGDGLVLDTGEFTVNNLYVDLYGIGIGPGGLDIQVAPSWTSSGSIFETVVDETTGAETTVEHEMDSITGFQVTAQYGMGGFFGLKDGGFSKVFAQYGAGAGSNFFSGSAGSLWSYGSWNNYTNENAEDASRMRAGAFGVLELMEGKLQIMPVVVYELNDNGADNDSQSTWMSAGFRPKYSVNDHFALQFEYGMDMVDADWMDDSSMMHKVTVAPTVTVGGGFWARPELRAYVTYATWSEEGDAGNSVFADETSGMIYGVQMEAWW